MKTVNDSKLYLYSGIVTAVLSVILMLPSAYSMFIVEPEISTLLSMKDSAAESYRKAYLMLRDPQIFAKYEHFDRAGGSVKEIIRYYDSRLMTGEELNPSDARYLSILLERRQKGSDLGVKSSLFVLLLSLMSWAAFFVEKKRGASATRN
jgi:hypothetical protein